MVEAAPSADPREARPLREEGGRTQDPRSPDAGGQVTRLISTPLTVASLLIPRSSVPVVLGASAVAVAGVIEWPLAAGVGLGYLALRRWH